MWNSFPAVQRLADAVHEVQPGHLLVPGLGIDADQLGVGKRLDERQRVADGRQQDVAARFVGLRLDREAQRIAVVGDVLAEQIERLTVALEGGLDVLGTVVLAALTPAPEDEGLRAEFGGEIDVAQHLAQREAAHGAVVAGESAVLEYRLGEQVRRHHRHDHARWIPVPPRAGRSHAAVPRRSSRTGTGRHRGRSGRARPVRPAARRPRPRRPRGGSPRRTDRRRSTPRSTGRRRTWSDGCGTKSSAVGTLDSRTDISASSTCRFVLRQNI